jgi:hypothetical protein
MIDFKMTLLTIHHLQRYESLELPIENAKQIQVNELINNKNVQKPFLLKTGYY